MEFNIDRTLEILSRTPHVLQTLLGGLSDDWLYGNEGENTWSPHAVVGHLIYADDTNWMSRVRKTLSDVDNKFEPFNRFAQFELYGNEKISDLLKKFSFVRENSLRQLSSVDLTASTLSRKAVHPDFGEVTLSQLLSTWTVHDLDHINQISRVMAKQYYDAVGPWKAFLGILKRPI